MVSAVEILFHQILEDRIGKKYSKEQALELLKQRYELSCKDIRKELGDDAIGNSFCCYVPCKFEKWIKICNDAERNKPFSSKKLNARKTIQNVMDKVSSKYKENGLAGRKAESGAIADVSREVNQIQNLCRENSEISELYEKYKAEIKNIQQISETPKPQLSEQITSDVVQREIERTLALLLKSSSVLRVKNNYCITKTVPQIWEELKTKKELGKIEIPEIDTIDNFICLYLRDQKGLSLDDAVRAARNRRTKTDKSE